jgi:2'-5' RNA ligase
MAWFFAVVPQGVLLRQLERIREKLELQYDEAAGIAWVPRHKLHMTLAHLTDAGDPQALIASAREHLEEHQPFEASVFGPIDFTERTGRRVIYVRCSEISRFGRLATACLASLGTGAIETDGPPFMGHITLARSRGSRAKERADWPFRGPEIGVLGVDRVVLFQRQAGAYIERAEFRLGEHMKRSPTQACSGRADARR